MLVHSSIRRLGIFILAAVGIQSCAIMSGPPEGGPKDTTPPKIKKVYPENRSVNFNQTTITIFYDEYVEVNDVAKEVVITPTLNVPPLITAFRKAVDINFTESGLRPNTTYIIQFGKAIKDINEGNLAAPFKYVFGTGSFLDSLDLEASAIAYPENNKPEGLKLMLYPADDDSAVLKRKPLYFASDTGGSAIRLSYLTPGKYSVFALADKNDNYTVDGGEYVGVYPAVIDLTRDTVLKEVIQMYPFTSAGFSLVDARPRTNQLSLKFSLPVDSVQVPGQDILPLYYSDSRDSVVVYPKAENFKDPLRISARRGTTVVDSTIRLDKPEAGAVSFTMTTESGAVALTKSDALLSVNVSEPISVIDTGRIRVLVGEKRWYGRQYGLVKTTPYSFAFSGTKKIPEGTLVKFVIFPGAVQGISGRSNKDTLTVPVNFPKREDFGYVEMKLTPPIAGESFVFQLVDPNKNINWSKNISRETFVVIQYMEPGDYTLRAFHDKNRNGVWDPGNPLTRELPEPFYYYPERMPVKANWDVRNIVFKPVM